MKSPLRLVVRVPVVSLATFILLEGRWERQIVADINLQPTLAQASTSKTPEQRASALSPSAPAILRTDGSALADPSSPLRRRTVATERAVPDNVDHRLTQFFALAESNRTALASGGAPRKVTSVAPEDMSLFQSQIQTDGADRALVSIRTARPVGTLVSALERAGAEVQLSHEKHKLAEAWLPASLLPTVASLEGVLSVTPVYRPLSRTGSVASQGDAILRTDQVRSNGFVGAPILVGALSDSALTLERSQANNDLPAVVDRYLEFPAEDEGRAMLEIIHDLAPGARLAHHSGILSELSFAEGIRELAAAGAKVIVDDLAYFSQPFFQDGILAQAVNEVVSSNGVVYVSAAGNEGDLSYEAFLSEDPGTQFHDFDPGPGADLFQQIALPEVPPGYQSTLTLVLQWDDPFFTTNGVTHDFDAFIYDMSETNLLAAAENNNVAMQQPSEILQWTRKAGSPTNVTIAIKRTAGDGQSRLKYILFGADAIDEWPTHSGTVFGQAASAHAIAVGAVPCYAPMNIEPFSARGDVTILFDPDGNRLASPEVRRKPDVVAPDNVNTTFFGKDIAEDEDKHPNFPGTSAAAPHVAGVAALLLGANPHLTPAESRNVLISTAHDVGTVGSDTVFGYGLVDALDALVAATNVVDVTPPVARLFAPIPLHGWPVASLVVGFSEPISPVTATNPANYQLLQAGNDGQWGSGDDLPLGVQPAYDEEARSVRLEPAIPGGVLTNGSYRLMIASLGGVTDPAGNPLNGGTNQVFDFTVADRSQIVTLEGGSSSRIALREGGSAFLVYPNNPRIHYSWPQIMLGRFDGGGRSDGPFRTAPTDIWNSWSVSYPDIAVSGDGGVAVYSDHVEIVYGEPDGYDISFQVFDANARPVGVRRYATWSWGNGVPRVAMNRAGRFVIAYRDLSYSYGPWGDTYLGEVYAKMFDSNGDPLGDAFKVNQEDGTGNPAVGISSNGTCVLAWREPAGILARRFDADGVAMGDAFVVTAIVIGNETDPEIAVAEDGSFIIAWSRSTEAASGVYARRFAANDVSQGGEVLVFPTSGSSLDHQVQVSLAPSGQFVVAWLSPDGDGNGVFAQRFASDGSPAGGRIWCSEGVGDNQIAPRIGIGDGGDFVVRWNNSAASSVGQMRWISAGALGGDAPFDGPWVRSRSPMAPVTGPITNYTVTFNRSIDAASFGVGDVGLIDPVGRIVVPTGIETADSRTFEIIFPEQALAGEYRVTVGPAIQDAAGRSMNQDGNAVPGQEVDRLSSTFILLPSPIGLAHSQDFESGSVDGLPGWSFVTTQGGQVVVTNTAAATVGSFSLNMFQTGAGYGSEAATLTLDLSGATNVTLDFWAKELTSSEGAAEVRISEDGVTWHTVLSFFAKSSAPRNWQHANIDLDAAVAQKGLHYDGDFYVQFYHAAGYYSRASQWLWDDIRVTTGVDVAGPRITSQTPSGRVSGVVTNLEITFDEPIDPTTFTGADVSITSPAGSAVLLDAGMPITDGGDHQTFSLNFAVPQSQAGQYRVVLGPQIADPAGNLMDQARSGIQGNSFINSFEIVGAVASLPFTEDFEATSLPNLGGFWSFNTTEQGGISLTQQDAAGGAQSLKMQHGSAGYGSEQAVLTINLAGATNVTLDFWATELVDNDGRGQVFISQNGTNWHLVTTLAGVLWRHVNIDLDAAVARAGMAYDADFHVRFFHEAGYYSRSSEWLWDDIRVASGIDVVGPRITQQQPSGPVDGPITNLVLTFSEPLDPATFTSADVTLVDPVGNTLALDVSTPITDSGDHQTFTLNLAEAQSLPGEYRVTIGPELADLNGNLMDQANTGLQGNSYQGTVEIRATVASLPFVEDFEVPSVGELGKHWKFATTLSGASQLAAETPPVSGKGSLKMWQLRNEYGSEQATVTLDLLGATNVTLDFWVKELANLDGMARVLISQDGTNWFTARTIGTGSAFVGVWRKFNLDLDAAVAQAGMAYDSDFHVQLIHEAGYYSRSSQWLWDDIRIASGVDVAGPWITNLLPSEAATAPLNEFILEFTEAMDGAAFTSEDVSVVDPVGRVVGLAGDPVDSGDGQSFTIPFAAPQVLAGTYRVAVGPVVLDVAGNGMDQNQDGQQGDAYTGSFQIGAVAQTVPSVQDFEGGTLEGLAGWSFGTTAGRIAVVETNGSHGGGYHVRMDNETAPGYTTTSREAVWKLDLAGQGNNTNLVLDFWLKRLGQSSSSSLLRVEVSGNGSNWVSVGSGLTPALDQYVHYAYDLDAVLAANSIAFDGDVFVRFQHSAYYSGSAFVLDDVRVGRQDISLFVPPTIVSSPQGVTVRQGTDVTLTVVANSPTPLAYRWQLQGTNLVGQTNDVLLLTNVQLEHAGNYRVWVSNFFDQVVSAIATLTVLPSNDDFEDRIPLASMTVSASGFNVGATSQTGEPYHFGSSGGKSVWWSWAAPVSGPVTVDTLGSSFDTIMAVYTNDTLASLVRIGSDDDGGGGGKSRVFFTASAGMVYQIAVDGYGGVSGHVALNLRMLLPVLTVAGLATNGVPQFQLSGPVGSNYVIQASSDLETWTRLLTNEIPAGGVVPLTDPSATNHTRRFYRAAAP